MSFSCRNGDTSSFLLFCVADWHWADIVVAVFVVVFFVYWSIPIQELVLVHSTSEIFVLLLFSSSYSFRGRFSPDMLSEFHEKFLSLADRGLFP